MPFIFLDRLSAQPVDWLWPGRLARGHLHIVDGDPGMGKSLVLLDLAARLSTGRPFPDGAPAQAPTAVVVLNAEDGARDTIVPRLAAAGGEASRVAVWERARGEPDFRLPSVAGQLEALLRQSGAGLVVFDPLLAFLDPAVNIGSDPSVRQALAPLAELAAAYRCAIVLLRHLNKEGGGRALYRGLASIAFIAACRIAWLIGADPKVPRRFVLAQVKNNLDPPAPSLAYAIAAGAGAAQVQWLGTSASTDADLLGNVSSRQRIRRQASEFLATYLRDGPRLAREAVAAGRSHGLSARTLRRALQDLAGHRHRLAGYGQEQKTYWLLPGQQLPAHLLPAGHEEIERLFRQVEEEAQRLGG